MKKKRRTPLSSRAWVKRTPIPSPEDAAARKLKEEEARWSSAYGQAIDNSLLIGVAAWDFNGRQTHANQAFCKMLGWTLDELRALEPPYPYWPPPEEGAGPQGFGSFKGPLQDGRYYEFRLRRKTGERFEALVCLSALKDPGGNPVGWVGSFGDITEHRRREAEIRRLNAELEDRVRRRTEQLERANRVLRKESAERRHSEEALRLSEERFRVSILNSPVTVFSQDSDLRYTWIYNPTPGYRAEDVIGRTDGELIEEPEDARGIEEIKRKVLEGGKGVRAEILIRRQGRRFFYDLTCEPLRDTADRVVGIICSAWDITEQKLASDQDRLRLAAAVEQAGEGVAITSPDGLISFVNPAFERMAGRPGVELVGKNYSGILIGEGENPDLKKNLEESFHRGESLTTHLTRKRMDGEMQELDVSCTPVRDQAGTVISYLAVERDVTQQHRLDQLMRQGQKLEALGTLAGGIAHDFNNVLMPIVLNTEMALLDLPAESAVRPYLDLALARP